MKALGDYTPGKVMTQYNAHFHSAVR